LLLLLLGMIYFWLLILLSRGLLEFAICVIDHWLGLSLVAHGSIGIIDHRHATVLTNRECWQAAVLRRVALAKFRILDWVGAILRRLLVLAWSRKNMMGLVAVLLIVGPGLHFLSIDMGLRLLRNSKLHVLIHRGFPFRRRLP